MKKKLEQLKKLLAEADKLAKEIADANPANGPVQALRGRVNAAGEMAGAIKTDDLKEVEPVPPAPAAN